MRRFHGQRAITALIVALFSITPFATVAQEAEGRPHLDSKMERPGEEGKKPRSEKQRALEEEARKLDEKIKIIDDKRTDDGRNVEEDQPSENRMTKADEISKKTDLTKSGNAEVHDIDTLLRKSGLEKSEPVQRKSAEDLSRQVIETRNEKGMYGLGSATVEVANRAGRDFVGEDARKSSDGTALVSKDGLRQYRFPEYKSKIDKTQANFERRVKPRGEWLSNGHVDIVRE